MTDENRCEPGPECTDGASAEVVLAALVRCYLHWQPDARVLGDVRSADAVRAIREMWEKANALVAPPATVAALVEALEAMMQGHKWRDAHTFIDGTPIGAGWSKKVIPEDAALTAARAALALYREAGR